jgi:hypothetical protein
LLFNADFRIADISVKHIEKNTAKHPRRKKTAAAQAKGKFEQNSQRSLKRGSIGCFWSVFNSP